MSKNQLAVLSFAGALFLVLYFGFDTRPKAQKKINKERIEKAESTSINSLLLFAKNNLQPEDASEILLAEAKLSEVENDLDSKIEAYKSLSSAWYKIDRYAIAGYYAQLVADQVATAEAWSIAGATYNRGIKLEKEEKVIEFCANRAFQAFENAISLEPTNVTHRVNLAVCYTDRAPKDNPMKGILMLIDLNKKYPDNVPTLSSLGRLGIQTGQFKKALGRLEKAIQLEPKNIKVNCLLAQAYEGLGLTEKAITFQNICQSLAEAQR